jgi:flagellar biosynthesis protein FliR
MGLSIAEAFNPMDETESNVLGEAIYMMAILVFFLINGHHFLVRGLAYSFTVIPIGKYSVSKSVYDLLIKYSASIFVIAVKIAAPMLISFFLINIGEGIITRVIPQMQIFFVTQPLKLGLGFVFLAASTPLIIFAVKGLLRSFEDNLFILIKAMGN